MPSGSLFLVGAGPGSLDHLTLRAAALLQTAEVVLYDALIDPALLQLVPEGCDCICVGKRGGQPSLTQPEIDAQLVALGRQGKRVVRLKSGDPFIFGRTTSEIQALKAANLAFEVVPGLSSALAGPLLANIPLTDPVISRCFAVVSAHEPDALDWASLAGIDTLVILMGTRHLDHIVERLLGQGRSPQTPVAIIRWAGHPQQQLWDGTLASIAQQVARQSLAPALILVGQVVALRPYLQPILPTDLSPPASPNSSNADQQEFYNQPNVVSLLRSLAAVPPSPIRPLTHCTVLVTRATGQASHFTQLLEAEGATVLELPTLEIAPPTSWEGLDGAIAQLSRFDWLILTSSNGVDFFFQRLLERGQDTRALAGIKIAVVGKKTAASLRQYGLQADFIPPDFVADALVESFPEPLAALNILFPRVESGGRELLVQAFTEAGASVVEVPAYRSGCTQSLPPALQQALETQQIQAITFASSKTVRCFHQLLSQLLSQQSSQQSSQQLSQQGLTLEALLAPVCLASIGPQTSETCREYFGRVDLEAAEFTLEGLTAALVKWASVSSLHTP